MKKCIGLVILFALLVGSASGATLTVNASGGAMYTRIQDAVNAASAGDIILVQSGTYYENVDINKSITLTGSGAEVTIVNASDPNNHVFNVRANWVNISGFTVTGATNSTSWPFRSGIFLNGANYINILNNTASSNHIGIQLFSSSSNNILTTNTVETNSRYGIYLRDSDNNNFTSNKVRNNYDGIILDSSSNNNIQSNNASNNIEWGIYLTRSGNNILVNNMMSQNRYNFNVYGDYLSQYLQDIDTTNKVDGKPIYYWVNQQNRQIPYDAGYVEIVNSSNITVKDLTLNNQPGVEFAYTVNSRIENVSISFWNGFLSGIVGQGIKLYYSSNNTITNSNFENNFYGIKLLYSDNNNIKGNNASNNQWNGISLVYSNSNLIIGNNVSYNGYRGISLDSYHENNTIYNNIFNNTNNFEFSGPIKNNTWNTTKTYGTNIVGGPYLGGNFWANPSRTGFSQTCTDANKDGICDSAYVLDANNIDYMPLLLNFTITIPSASTIGYSALVATGQNTYVQSTNGSFGLLLKGHSKTINNSVILNNTGDISAKVEARFNDSIAGVFGLVSGANVLNATNFALGLPSSLVPLNSLGADVQVAVAPPGVTALDARLGVPADAVAGDYSGTVVLTFSNNV